MFYSVNLLYSHLFYSDIPFYSLFILFSYSILFTFYFIVHLSRFVTCVLFFFFFSFALLCFFFLLCIWKTYKSRKDVYGDSSCAYPHGRKRKTQCTDEIYCMVAFSTIVINAVVFCLPYSLICPFLGHFTESWCFVLIIYLFCLFMFYFVLIFFFSSFILIIFFLFLV